MNRPASDARPAADHPSETAPAPQDARDLPGDDASLPGDDASPDRAEIQPDVTPVDGSGADLPPEPPVDLATGLIGYWKMDETTGVIAADSSGAGHHGTLENIDPAKAWMPARRGGGLKVTAAPLTSGVRVEPTVAINGLQHFTAAAWVFLNGGNTRYQTVISRQLDNDEGEVFNLTFVEQDLTLYLPRVPPGDYAVRVNTDTPLSRWVHVAATFDGTTARVYSDGVQVGTFTYQTRLGASTMPLYLGTNKNVTTMNQPLQGVLDDVVLYSVALSPAAIKTLAAGSVPPDR